MYIGFTLYYPEFTLCKMYCLKESSKVKVYMNIYNNKVYMRALLKV